MTLQSPGPTAAELQVLVSLAEGAVTPPSRRCPFDYAQDRRWLTTKDTMRTKDTVAAVAFVGSIGMSPHLVRSLRRDTEPDDTACCVGDGWWLSTSEG